MKTHQILLEKQKVFIEKYRNQDYQEVKQDLKNEEKLKELGLEIKKD